MHGIFTYIYPKTGPNVGKYSIHGASGQLVMNVKNPQHFLPHEIAHEFTAARGFSWHRLPDPSWAHITGRFRAQLVPLEAVKPGGETGGSTVRFRHQVNGGRKNQQKWCFNGISMSISWNFNGVFIGSN